MRVNGDLQILELEWEELDATQLNSPTQIQKHLADTKVHISSVLSGWGFLREL